MLSHRNTLVVFCLVAALFVGLPFVQAQESDDQSGQNETPKEERSARKENKQSDSQQSDPKQNADREERRRRTEEATRERMLLIQDSQTRRAPGKFEMNHADMRRAFRDVVREARQSTVAILGDGEQAALGVIVSSDGYILTKASELRGKIECQLAGKKKLPAELVGVDKANDLALLKIDAKEELSAIRWIEDDAQLMIGSFLATTGLEDDPVSVGVASVPARKLSRGAVLGIGFKQDAKAPVIGEVLADSPAAKAGLKSDDLILKINTTEVDSKRKVVEVLGGHAPGDQIEITLKRGDEELSIKAELGSRLNAARQSRFDQMNLTSGPLSERRGAFPSALQHDTVLRPWECGGPLVDLSGKAVGINIARAGRIESYAIPAKVAVGSFEKMRSGDLAPSEVFQRDLKLRALDHRIRSHELELVKAKRAKAEAERTMERAARQIEKATNERAELAK